MPILRTTLASHAALCAALAFAQLRGGDELFRQALVKEKAEGKLNEAIQLYERVAREFPSERAVAARALLRLGGCYQKLGRLQARGAYERLLRDYPEQREAVLEARARLRVLRPAAPSDSGVLIRRVWTAEVGDPVLVGAPSPDGRYVPVCLTDAWRLAIRDLATGKERSLPADVAAMEPVFSPDGKSIAYRKLCEMRLIALDGSPPRVFPNGADVRCVYISEWSLDGRRILLSRLRRDRHSEIVELSVRDGVWRILKEGTSGRASYSPDARHIAYERFSRESPRTRDIYVKAVDDSNDLALIVHPGDDSVLGWVPDGSGLLFASDRTGTRDIWFQPLDGIKPRGAPVLIKKDAGPMSPKGFARNGAFHYVVRNAISDVYTAAIDVASGKVLAAPAPATHRFLRSNWGPAWSPSGRYLIFHRLRAGKGVLCVLDTETGQERELAPDLTLMQYSWSGPPHWSADERAIAIYARGRDGRGGVFRIDAQTAAAEPIALKQDEGWYRYPFWASDQAALFYMDSLENKSYRIARRELESGRETLMFESGGMPLNLALSPDGRELAFHLWDRGRTWTALQVMPASGGTARELLRVREPEQLAGLAWTPDGRFLLFGRSRDYGKHTQLWGINADGKEPRYLGLAVGRMEDLSVHRDGRRIAFGIRDESCEIWAIENFLPTRRPAR